jgi:hypothetical protein
MERNPEDLLQELGHDLTLWSLDLETYDTNERLVEAIQLFLRYLVLPSLPKGSDPEIEWTNGLINIFISIHVEGEDQNSYSIELTKVA